MVDCKRIRKGAFSAGHQMRTVPMLALLVVNPRRSTAPAAQLRRTYDGICHFFSRDLTVQHGLHHPCWKAGHFLPCTRPPDVMRMHRPPKRATYGPSQLSALLLDIAMPGYIEHLTPCSRRDTSLCSKLSRHPLPRAAHPEGISSFCFFLCFLVMLSILW